MRKYNITICYYQEEAGETTRKVVEGESAGKNVRLCTETQAQGWRAHGQEITDSRQAAKGEETNKLTGRQTDRQID